MLGTAVRPTVLGRSRGLLSRVLMLGINWIIPIDYSLSTKEKK